MKCGGEGQSDREAPPRPSPRSRPSRERAGAAVTTTGRAARARPRHGRCGPRPLVRAPKKKLVVPAAFTREPVDAPRRAAGADRPLPASFLQDRAQGTQASATMAGSAGIAPQARPRVSALKRRPASVSSRGETGPSRGGEGGGSEREREREREGA
jgi:hypothetical protein